MAAAIKAFFSRNKKAKVLACTMPLEADGSPHVHGDACFIDIFPLIVVELFQSQGCKSCPPVIPLVHKAINNPNLLLLTYDVTYWDQSGWKDTFGSTQWDQRQKSYVKQWGRNGIFTPQVIASGVSDGIGAKDGEVEDIVAKAMQAQNMMDWMVGIDVRGSMLRVSSDKAEMEMYDVIVAAYDPDEKVVKVGKGPNKGKKMVHRNLVQQLMKVGQWSGGIAEIQLPDMPPDNLERAAMVQKGPGGPIVAAMRF